MSDTGSGAGGGGGSEQAGAQAGRQSARQAAMAARADVARRLWLLGLLCLPFLWLVNLVFFKRFVKSLILCPKKDRATAADASDERRLRTYLLRSLVCFVMVTAAFVAWVVVFQTSYKEWGQTGEDLLVVKPNENWWE